MAARESEAIILRTYPLGEADRLVSFLSRSWGRLRGVAAGARRTRSRFGSTLELLSHVRIWFFERETRELVRINQCELVESFLKAQQDYPRSLGLALVSEVAENVLPEREASDAMFRLILLSARAIQEHPSTSLIALDSVLSLPFFAGVALRRLPGAERHSGFSGDAQVRETHDGRETGIIAGREDFGRTRGAVERLHAGLD